MDIMFFFFVLIISLYCFTMSTASLGFSALSGLSFNSSASIISLLIMESINCFLISSLLDPLVFLVFSESLCNCKPKNNHYTTNLKHPLHTKNVHFNFKIVLKRVVLYMIKVHRHHRFCKNCFFGSTLRVKHLKSFC